MISLFGRLFLCNIFVVFSSVTFTGVWYMPQRILGAISDKWPGFWKCLRFSESGFSHFQTLLTTKIDQHSQHANDRALW